MANIKQVLENIGYEEKSKQNSLVKLLHFTGAFDSISKEFSEILVLNDASAQKIINSDLFSSNEEAISWLKDVTSEKFTKKDINGKVTTSIKISDPDFQAKYGDNLNDILHKLGVIEEVKPKSNNYDHAAIVASTPQEVSDRIDHLVELYKHDGVRFNNLALLGSNGLLLPEVEREAAIEMLSIKLPKKSDNSSEDDEDREGDKKRVEEIFDEVNEDEKLSSEFIADATKRNKAKIDAISEKLGLSEGDWPTEIEMMQHIMKHNKEKLEEIGVTLDKVKPLEVPMYKISLPDSMKRAHKQNKIEKNSMSLDELLSTKEDKRSNSIDVVKVFLKDPRNAKRLVKMLDPKNSSSGIKFLFVSSQPNVSRQKDMLESMAYDKKIDIDVVGKRTNSSNTKEAINYVYKSVNDKLASNNKSYGKITKYSYIEENGKIVENTTETKELDPNSPEFKNVENAFTAMIIKTVSDYFNSMFSRDEKDKYLLPILDKGEIRDNLMPEYNKAEENHKGIIYKASNNPTISNAVCCAGSCSSTLGVDLKNSSRGNALENLSKKFKNNNDISR